VCVAQQSGVEYTLHVRVGGSAAALAAGMTAANDAPAAAPADLLSMSPPPAPATTPASAIDLQVDLGVPAAALPKVDLLGGAGPMAVAPASPSALDASLFAMDPTPEAEPEAEAEAESEPEPEAEPVPS
jgi:hypothetical protein